MVKIFDCVAEDRGKGAWLQLSDVKFISSKQEQVEKQRSELPTRNERNTKQFADTFTPAYAFGAAPRTTYYWLDNSTPCEDEVVQRQHIKGGEVDQGAGTGVDLPKSEWPTMVYESMGTSLDQCLSVYKESQKYPGNSICIFGLNARKEQGEQGEPEKGQGKKLQKAIPETNAVSSNRQQPYHLLYTCSFTWETPKRANKGYDMPFVEARLLLMRNAAEIVSNVVNSSQSETDKSQSYKFLYRWIDGDATDDTTNQLQVKELQEMADNQAIQIVTGRYDWRHQDPKTEERTMYHQFIERINESEKILRDYYYELADRRENSFNEEFLHQQLPGRALVLSAEQRWFPLITARALNAPDKDKNAYLPGYYLPETTMLMNGSAHNQVSYIYDLKMNFGEGSQDKESMKIFDKILKGSGNEEKLPENTVIYRSELSVKKPLKHEFEKSSYLGGAMLDFFKEEKGDIEDFANALKKIRQSAWGDQWYFVSENGWNDWDKKGEPKNEEENRQELFNCKRRMLMNKLWYGFFEGNRKKIYKELDTELKADNASQ